MEQNLLKFDGRIVVVTGAAGGGIGTSVTRMLAEAGANTVIKSDDNELIRHLYLEAAKTVRYGGVAPDAALRMITLNAARELGLDSRLGSIEVGKDADLAVFSGHPLNAFSRCEMTLIEGEPFFTHNSDSLWVEGMGSAITKCRADFGAEIDLDLRPLQLEEIRQ